MMVDDDSPGRRCEQPCRPAEDYGDGCVALTSRLRSAAWPPKFRPDLFERYDGMASPTEFLQIYVRNQVEMCLGSI